MANDKPKHPLCQFCGQFTGEDDSVATEAIAFAPQDAPANAVCEYTWVPVCADHLDGWYEESPGPGGMPPPFAVGEEVGKSGWGLTEEEALIELKRKLENG
jgi:hypothetical protein